MTAQIEKCNAVVTLLDRWQFFNRSLLHEEAFTNVQDHSRMVTTERHVWLKGKIRRLSESWQLVDPSVSTARKHCKEFAVWSPGGREGKAIS